MKKSMLVGLPSIVVLQSFTVFPEYFVSISIIYVLIVVVLITYNVFGLMLQKALSECVALILLMACYLILNDDLITLNFISFHNSIVNDYLAFLTKFLVCFFSIFYFLFISNTLKEQKLTSFEYLLVLLFAVLGLMLMCCSNDLLFAYLAIELSSLALYILASFKKTSSYSIESGLKYFITGAVSSAFFLLGSSFLYLSSGSIYFDDFLVLYESEMFDWIPSPAFYIGLPFGGINPDWVKNIAINNYLQFIDQPILLPNDIFFNSFDYSFVELGVALIIFSLFIKLATAPFHLWSLDVYEGSPTSSTFFFAAISKFSIFVLLTRFCYISFYSLFEELHFYFLIIGVFSVFIGSFGGLKQRKLKTLLAYSSITNMGYALLAFGTGVNLGLQMLFFHMIIYTVSSLCTWSVLLMLRLKTKKNINKYNKELSDLSLLKKSNPSLAFSFALTMFSIAGIPPLIGFLAKMGVFLTLMGNTFYFFVFVSAVFSVLSTFYYIRIIKILYFENVLVGKLYYPIKTTKTIFISILVVLLFLLFLNPSILYIYCYKLIPLVSNNV